MNGFDIQGAMEISTRLREMASLAAAGDIEVLLKELYVDINRYDQIVEEIDAYQFAEYNGQGCNSYG